MYNERKLRKNITFFEKQHPPPSKCFFYLVGAHRKLEKAFWGGGMLLIKKKFSGGGCCLQNHQILPRGGMLPGSIPPPWARAKKQHPPLRQGGDAALVKKWDRNFEKFFSTGQESIFFRDFWKCRQNSRKLISWFFRNTSGFCFYLNSN